MGPRLGLTHFAHKKGMGSPCLRLTLTQHAIFVEKTGPRGGCVRGVGGLALLVKKYWIHLV